MAGAPREEPERQVSAAAAAPVSDVPAPHSCAMSRMRAAPPRYALRHRAYTGFADVDRFPELPCSLGSLARLGTRDHFTGDRPSPCGLPVRPRTGRHETSENAA